MLRHHCTTRAGKKDKMWQQQKLASMWDNYSYIAAGMGNGAAASENSLAASYEVKHVRII